MFRNGGDMKIEIQYRANEFMIVTDDGTGNGIIVASGRLSGVKDIDNDERKKILEEMAEAWNNTRNN